MQKILNEQRPLCADVHRHLFGVSQRPCDHQTRQDALLPD